MFHLKACKSKLGGSFSSVVPGQDITSQIGHYILIYILILDHCNAPANTIIQQNASQCDAIQLNEQTPVDWLALIA